MKKNTRIAMLITSYYPRLGGAERQLAAVLPYLRDFGMDVRVITRRYKGLAEFEIIDRVQVFRLPIPGPKVTASISFTLNGISLLRKLKPDIIHAHELFSPTTTAVFAKQILGIPVVVTAHRSGVLGDVHRLNEKLFGAPRMAIFREKVDAFISISNEIDDELASVGIPSESRFYIPNAVDEDKFKPLSPKEKKSLRFDLGLPDVPIVVFSGRLAPEKRVENLIEVWPVVRSEIPEALLLIVGSGMNEDLLKKQAGDGVWFTGGVDNVVSFLQAADVFVLPSIAEGLSVAMLEAMSTGLPVVATRVGGAPDAIISGENGMLIPVDDLDELRSVLMVLLQNERLRLRLGSQARESIMDNFNMPSTAKKLTEVYQMVASKYYG